MGFGLWEGEYTAVQLINNNELTCVPPFCLLGISSKLHELEGVDKLR